MKAITTLQKLQDDDILSSNNAATIISNAIKVLYLINLGFLHNYKKSLTELMKRFKL